MLIKSSEMLHIYSKLVLPYLQCILLLLQFNQLDVVPIRVLADLKPCIDVRQKLSFVIITFFSLTGFAGKEGDGWSGVATVAFLSFQLPNLNVVLNLSTLSIKILTKPLLQDKDANLK